MPFERKKYPPDWEEIVERIRERSGDCCEQCKLPNHSKVWSVPFQVRDDKGRYKRRMIWFRDYNDAKREAGLFKIIKTVKVVLTTAHLDHDEENWEVEDDRLKHLCQLCHLRMDAVEKYQRSLKK